MKRRSFRATLALAFGLLLMASFAYGRAGGGDSWGGGGGGGGGGGSGGGGGGGDGWIVQVILEILLRWISFCIECPQVGLPITAVVALAVYFWYRSNNRNSSATSVSTLSAQADPKGWQWAAGSLAKEGGLGRSGREVPLAQAAPALMQSDPYFSMPLFLDFAQLLFTRFHRQRGLRKLDPLRPYVAEEVLERSLTHTPADVREVDRVLIGASRVLSFRVEPAPRIVVRFLANYRETTAAGATVYYAEETWTFRRDAGVRSKPPEEILRLGCPSCGAADEPLADGSCAHCRVVVREGRFHWFVGALDVDARRPATNFSPASGEEIGTDHPTLLSPTLAEDKRAFAARHPEFSWDAFRGLGQAAFLAIQKAWSEQRWEEARALETDPLFNVHRYWIDQYKSAGLTNRLDDVKIGRVVPVKMGTDAFYETITVRIFASGLEYTVDGKQEVVAGSRTARRSFSEYWTFLRRIGHEGKGEAARGECPGCGAPLKINMAGVCEFCGSKVASGDFGWVLTSIEQDEEYRG